MTKLKPEWMWKPGRHGPSRYRIYIYRVVKVVGNRVQVKINRSWLWLGKKELEHLGPQYDRVFKLDAELTPMELLAWRNLIKDIDELQQHHLPPATDGCLPDTSQCECYWCRMSRTVGGGPRGAQAPWPT